MTMFQQSCGVMSAHRSSERIKRLTFQTEAAQLRLFRILREVRPFCERERYLGYLKVRYRFSQYVQPAYTFYVTRYYLPDLDRRSRLAQLVLDITDFTPERTLGIQKQTSKPLDSLESSSLGWLLVAEVISSFSPIFLRKVAALGLDETFGARHLSGTPERARRQWQSLSDAVAMSLTDRIQVSLLTPAILSALDYLETLIAEELPYTEQNSPESS